MKNELLITGRTQLPAAMQLPSGIKWVDPMPVYDAMPPAGDKAQKPFLLRLGAHNRDGLLKKLRTGNRKINHCYGVLFPHLDAMAYADLQWYVNLRIQCPSLPVLYTVSQETKTSRMQKVLHLGVDGLYFDMDALSARETAKLKRLELFSGVMVEPQNNKQLLALRKKIDTLDDAILNLLSERIKTVETLAGIKKNSRMKIVQAARWKEVVTLALDHARKKGIDEDALLNILEAIHLNAIRVQGKKYQKD